MPWETTASPFSNDLLLRLINMVLVAIEFFTLVVLSSGFFIQRYKGIKYFVSIVIGYFINYGILIVFGNILILKLVLSCVLFTLLLKIIYEVHPIYGLVLSVLYLSMVTVMDGVLLFSISWISNRPMSILLSNPYEYYLLSFFAKIIELFIVTLIRTWGKSRFHQRTATWQGYIRVFVFPLASLVSTIILLQAFIQYPDAAPQLFACVFILLLSDIAAIVLLDQFETQQQTILDNRVLQQDLKSAHDNITALSSAYATERKLTHDFQNKISVIQGLISESDSNSAALSYLDQLVNQSYTHSLAVTTHRIVVDVVLNQKYLVAVKKAISFRVQLSDLSSFPFTDESFVVVLSNILDNAIEACEKIEDSSKRFVLVKAQSSPEESILYVENSIASRVKIINNRVETTKQNSMQHGYGLQNISAIVKEAGGTYALNSTDEVFSCVIHFN